MNTLLSLPLPSVFSAGSNVRRSDVTNLGASYEHNFKLHAYEWASDNINGGGNEIVVVTMVILIIIIIILLVIVVVEMAVLKERNL